MNLIAKKTVSKLKRTYREFSFALGRHTKGLRGREGFELKITTPEGQVTTLRTVQLPLDSQLEAIAKRHGLEGKNVRDDVIDLLVGVVGEELDSYARSEEDDD